MEPRVKILFVCIGNLCRSPAAAAIFRHLAETAGATERFVVDSAGTIGTNNGKRPDRRMRKAVKKVHGIKLDSRARQMVPDDLIRYHLVLGMDRQVMHDIRVVGAGRRTTAKVEMLGAYCRHYESPEIPDPFMGPKELFPRVVDLLDDACASLLEELLSAE